MKNTRTTKTASEQSPNEGAITGIASTPDPSQEILTSEPREGRRDATGRVGVGNTLALKSGIYSRQLQDDAAPWRAEQVARITADQAEIATLKEHTIEQAGTLLVILQHLAGNLMAEGPLTAKGRQRAAMTAYLQVLDRYERLAKLIGLERRAKSVDPLGDYMRARHAE